MKRSGGRSSRWRAPGGGGGGGQRGAERERRVLPVLACLLADAPGEGHLHAVGLGLEPQLIGGVPARPRGDIGERERRGALARQAWGSSPGPGAGAKRRAGVPPGRAATAPCPAPPRAGTPRAASPGGARWSPPRSRWRRASRRRSSRARGAPFAGVGVGLVVAAGGGMHLVQRGELGGVGLALGADLDELVIEPLQLGDEPAGLGGGQGLGLHGADVHPASPRRPGPPRGCWRGPRCRTAGAAPRAGCRRGKRGRYAPPAPDRCRR